MKRAKILPRLLAVLLALGMFVGQASAGARQVWASAQGESGGGGIGDGSGKNGSVSGGGTIGISLSYQADSSGFAIPRKAFKVAPGLSEQYGYEDAFGGEKASALDAIVAAHVAVYGEDKEAVNGKLQLSNGSYGDFISNFMGDGAGNMMYYVNGASAEVGAPEHELRDGDTVELFAIRDTVGFADRYGWFKYGGAKTEALSIEARHVFIINLQCSTWEGDAPVPNARIMEIDAKTGAFGQCLSNPNGDGNANIVFGEAGTYVVGATEMKGEPPLGSPWLTVTVTEAERLYTDVGEEDKFYDVVKNVKEKGLMVGTGGGAFEPEASLTRAMLATIMYRLDGEPEAEGGPGTGAPSAASAFSDVPGGQWYARAVAWASASGVVGGYGNGLYGPDDSVTREQLAAVLYNYAELKNIEIKIPDHAINSFNSYPDKGDTSEWAVPAMAWAVRNGMIMGRSDTLEQSLVPGSAAMRYEAAFAVVLLKMNMG